MRRTLVRLAGLASVAAALASGATAAGQTGLGVVPDGLAAPAGASAYTVTPQAGPWLICVASYSGPPSQGLAEELAQEIRAKFQLPAYVFNRSAEEKQREKERVARIREAQRQRLIEAGLSPDTKLPVKTIRIEDQYAVLVGGYKDDAAARKALDDVRKLQPSEKYQQWAYVPDASGKMHEQPINPFRAAFVCRNPSAPVEKQTDNKPDLRLKEYNADEKYSLLKCPKPWTLVVKSYQGATAVLQQQSTPSSVMDKMWPGKKNGELLNAAAKQAHELAGFLHKFGFEAYVLHTEYSSYVTLGGFDGPDDPKLLQLRQAFVSEMGNPGSNIGQLHVKAMVGFIAQPMPMPVPRVQ
jgi:hypothetical protein